MDEAALDAIQHGVRLESELLGPLILQSKSQNALLLFCHVGQSY